MVPSSSEPPSPPSTTSFMRSLNSLHHQPLNHHATADDSSGGGNSPPSRKTHRPRRQQWSSFASSSPNCDRVALDRVSPSKCRSTLQRCNRSKSLHDPEAIPRLPFTKNSTPSNNGGGGASATPPTRPRGRLERQHAAAASAAAAQQCDSRTTASSTLPHGRRLERRADYSGFLRRGNNNAPPAPPATPKRSSGLILVDEKDKKSFLSTTTSREEGRCVESASLGVSRFSRRRDSSPSSKASPTCVAHVELSNSFSPPQPPLAARQSPRLQHSKLMHPPPPPRQQSSQKVASKYYSPPPPRCKTSPGNTKDHGAIMAMGLANHSKIALPLLVPPPPPPQQQQEIKKTQLYPPPPKMTKAGHYSPVVPVRNSSSALVVVAGSSSRRSQESRPTAGEDNHSKNSSSNSTNVDRMNTIISPYSHSQVMVPQEEEAAAAAALPCNQNFTGFRQDYKLGEKVRFPSHMIVEPSSTKATEAVNSMENHDFAFVKRSDGTYSYSILAYRSKEAMTDEYAAATNNCSNNHPEQELEECMTFVISAAGCTKMIKKSKWSEYVRLVSTKPGTTYTSSSQEKTRPATTTATATDKNAKQDNDSEEEITSNHEVEEYLKKLRQEFYSTRPATVGDGWVPPSMISFDPSEDDISVVSDAWVLECGGNTSNGIGMGEKKYVPSQPIILE